MSAWYPGGFIEGEVRNSLTFLGAHLRSVNYDILTSLRTLIVRNDTGNANFQNDFVAIVIGSTAHLREKGVEIKIDPFDDGF